MYCRNCGKEIEKNAVECPHCGEVFHITKKMSIPRKIALILATVSAAVIIFGIIAIFTDEFLEDTINNIEHQHQHFHKHRHNDRTFD